MKALLDLVCTLIRSKLSRVPIRGNKRLLPDESHDYGHE